MTFSQPMQKGVACWVAMSFFYLSVVVHPAYAGLVDTPDIVSAKEYDMAREKVTLLLQRQDVANHLHALGVDMDEASARIEAMTAHEIHLLSQKIDQIPAGGDGLGFVVGVAIIAFVTLIITDIAGVTDVFTFIKKR